MSVSLGFVNPELIQDEMIKMVKEAISIIREERFKFSRQAKTSGYNRGKADLVTSADYAAQAMYLRRLHEVFPEFGIIAEEDDFRSLSKSTAGNFLFTIDPVDGTLAFGKRQSHGVTTMISLVRDGVVIAACVGDINTQEIYCYGPGSNMVSRISDYEHTEELSADPERALKSQRVLLRDAPENYSSPVQEMVRAHSRGGLFSRLAVDDDPSFGWSVSRLWKGEVGAFIFKGGLKASWDMAPVIGISRAMGFVFGRCEIIFDAKVGRGKTIFKVTPFAPDDYLITDDFREYKEETVVVHISRLPELFEWVSNR